MVVWVFFYFRVSLINKEMFEDIKGLIGWCKSKKDNEWFEKPCTENERLRNTKLNL